MACLKILELEIDIVYVAIPQAGKSKIKEVLNLVEKTGAQIKLFPPFYEILNGSNSNKLTLRDINIEDLLGREPIKLEEGYFLREIADKYFVKTGIQRNKIYSLLKACQMSKTLSLIYPRTSPKVSQALMAAFTFPFFCPIPISYISKGSGHRSGFIPDSSQ